MNDKKLEKDLESILFNMMIKNENFPEIEKIPEINSLIEEKLSNYNSIKSPSKDIYGSNSNMNELLKQSLKEMQDPDQERKNRLDEYLRRPKLTNLDMLLIHKTTTNSLRNNPNEIKISFPSTKEFSYSRYSINNAKNEIKNEQNGNEKSVSMIRTSNITMKTTKANCDITNLSKINIKDLKIEQTHFGKYMILKIIERPFKRNAIQFILEDENKDYICLSIYNYEKKHYFSSYHEIDLIFPINSYILIFEPFFKVYVSLSSGLRVDDPEEIMLFKNLSEFHFFLNSNTISSDMDLKMQGNKFISEGQYAKAVVCYKQAISKNPQNAILFANLAEAYLRLGFNTKVIYAADEALKLGLNNEKILFRKAKANFNLSKYDECIGLLKNNIFLNCGNSEIINNVEKLRKESICKYEIKKYGKFDFLKIFEEEKQSFYLDYSDFINEKVEIGFCNEKGIFVKAKEKVSRGELISATKAFACTSLLKNVNNKNSLDEGDCDFNILKTNKDNTQFYIESTHEEVRKKILDLLIGKEEDHPEFFALYDGNNKKDDYEKRLNFLKKNKQNYGITDKNIFLSEKKFDQSLTIEKIDKILKHNAFKTIRGVVKPNVIASGLWIFPSFLNHSCVPNTTYFGIGDFLFIKAQRDIEKNEEITLNYVSYVMRFDKRYETLQSQWGFNCDCNFCIYQLKNFKDNKLKLYAFDFLQCFEDSKIEKLMNKIKKETFDSNLQNQTELLETDFLPEDIKNKKSTSEFLKNYKSRVNDETQKEWIRSFNENPRKFYEFLMENKKVFSKIEMCIILKTYSYFVWNDNFDKNLYTEILEKAYSYCNCFQIICEIKILVNLVQSFLMNSVLDKYIFYKQKLTELLNSFYGNNEDIQAKFLNAITY